MYFPKDVILCTNDGTIAGMNLILLNKPYGVMSQFSAHPTRPTLASLIPIPGVYPAGRLDAESEGLLLLTDDGQLQNRISHPEHKRPKTYLVQVEGAAQAEQLARLAAPMHLGDFTTLPCHVSRIAEPDWLWPRQPPVRSRTHIPTTWLAITLSEGKNRQVRRMTAAVGLPTLRLIRSSVAGFSLADYPLWPGEWCTVQPEDA